MDILNMISGGIQKIVNLDKSNQIDILDSSEWDREEPELMKRELPLYTEGSKRLTGTRAG